MQRVRRTTAVAVLPADPVGGTPGYFPLPNPGGGVPAAVPGYEWYNNVQEELVSVILAGGIALDGTNRAQLLAALRAAGVFTTPSQFDNTTKAATTAFVQANSGADVGIVSISAAGTMTAAAHAGALVQLSGTTYAETLPLASTVRAGSKISFITTTSGIVTLNRQSTDLLFPPNGGSLTTLNLSPGDTLTLESNGTTGWMIVGGSVALAYSAGQFGSSLVANGYQKLPSGLIVQWGILNSSGSADVTLTYPIAFPNACRSITGNVFNGTATLNASVVFGNINTNPASVPMSAWTATGTRTLQSVVFIAIGY